MSLHRPITTRHEQRSAGQSVGWNMREADDCSVSISASLNCFFSSKLCSFSTMVTIIAPSPDDKRIYRLADLLPGTVNRAEEVIAVPSGKGVNAARALNCVAARVHLVFPAGTAFYLDLQRDESMHGVLLDAMIHEHPTRCCVTLLASNGTATEIVQEAGPLSAKEARRYQAQSLHAIVNATALLLAGSLPAGLSIDFYESCVRLARNRGIPVVVDAHGTALLSALHAQPEVVKITRAELASTLSLTQDDYDVEAACSSLREEGAQHVVLTDGEKPVTVVENDGSVWTLTPEAVRLVNAIGSGDSMSGGVALALSRGMPLRSAVALGMRMGAANAATLLPGHVALDLFGTDTIFSSVPGKDQNYS
jgi:tagatose 6-phosphate kinase